MCGGQADKDVAVFQVAFDVICFHALADNIAAFLNKAGDEIRGILTVTLFDRLQACVQAIYNLSAIAPRGAPANLRALDDGNVITLFSEVQRCG